MKNNEIVLCLGVFFFLASLGFVSSWTGVNTQYWNDGVGCFNSNNFAVWTNITPVGATYNILNLSVVFNSSGSVGNCSAYRDISNITCCPTGYECSLVSGKCTPKIDRSCEDFKTKESCETANMVSGENPSELFFKSVGDEWKIEDKSVYESKCTDYDLEPYELGGEFCANSSSCLCYWNSSTSSCKPGWEDYTICEGGLTQKGRCEYEIAETKNECDTLGKITRIYKATAFPTGYPGCIAPPNKEVSCSTVIVVPFFSFMNMIISILGIAGIYLFSRKN